MKRRARESVKGKEKNRWSGWGRRDGGGVEWEKREKEGRREGKAGNEMKRMRKE